MGGAGSGNRNQWWRPPKKRAVESCEALDINRWAREGILEEDTSPWEGLRRFYGGIWENSSRRATGMNYEVDTRDPARAFVQLSYKVKRQGVREPEALDYRIRFTSTRTRFGALRWWFLCPMIVEGRECGRRVAKLYLPPNDLFFGCRSCHALAYASCQRSRKNDRLWRAIAASMGIEAAALRRMVPR